MSCRLSPLRRAALKVRFVALARMIRRASTVPMRTVAWRAVPIGFIGAEAAEFAARSNDASRPTSESATATTSSICGEGIESI